MTIKERMEAIKALEQVEVPFEFKRFFPHFCMMGAQVGFCESGDFGDIHDMQLLTLWMVEQFGVPAETPIPPKLSRRKSGGKK